MKKLFGGILLAVGILIAGASGLCSLAVLAGTLSGGGANAGMAPLVLLFGGIPFVIGLGLFFAGRAMIRAAARDERGE